MVLIIAGLWIKMKNRLAFGQKVVIVSAINQGPFLIGGPVSF